jgi:hypothetical protein
VYQFRTDKPKKTKAFPAIESMGQNPDCPLGLAHIPNEKTQKIMRDVDAGIGLKKFNSLEELFADLKS